MSQNTRRGLLGALLLLVPAAAGAVVPGAIAVETPLVPIEDVQRRPRIRTRRRRTRARRR